MSNLLHVTDVEVTRWAWRNGEPRIGQGVRCSFCNMDLTSPVGPLDSVVDMFGEDANFIGIYANEEGAYCDNKYCFPFFDWNKVRSVYVPPLAEDGPIHFIGSFNLEKLDLLLTSIGNHDPIKVDWVLIDRTK